METKKVIGEDPCDFVLNDGNPCIVICHNLLSEGYECPSVISFYGHRDSANRSQLSEYNLYNRSVANLIVFQEPKKQCKITEIYTRQRFTR